MTWRGAVEQRWRRRWGLRRKLLLACLLSWYSRLPLLGRASLRKACKCWCRHCYAPFLSCLGRLDVRVHARSARVGRLFQDVILNSCIKRWLGVCMRKLHKCALREEVERGEHERRGCSRARVSACIPRIAQRAAQPRLASRPACPLLVWRRLLRLTRARAWRAVDCRTAQEY